MVIIRQFLTLLKKAPVEGLEFRGRNYLPRDKNMQSQTSALEKLYNKQES